MNYALVGWGRMGQAIDSVAKDRGHQRIAVIDPELEGDGICNSLDAADLSGAEVAFEFTHPGAAESNVVGLLEAGVAVVCGTTGWNVGSEKLQQAAKTSKAGAVIAPNFSLGMNMFYAVVRDASRMVGAVGSYEPCIVETHHRGKRDAPSGTARELARLMSETGGWSVHVGDPDDRPIPSGTIHVASVRAGFEPGSHTVSFDGEHDSMHLTHHARGRGGFALGSVLAGEWVVGRRGVHAFDSVLDALLKEGGQR